MTSTYILLTPVRNEEKYIEKLIHSIISQSLKPRLWLIIDDNSTDRTSTLLDKVTQRYSWIRVVHQHNQNGRDLRKNYSRICVIGFKKLVGICKKQRIHWDYIGLVDGDMQLDSNYFRYLIRKFIENRNLGIASAVLFSTDGNKIIKEPMLDNWPKGSPRLWRKACFWISQYIVTYCPDSVSNVHARLKGWDLRNYDEIYAVQQRPTSSYGGMWNGYQVSGEGSYYLNFNPLHVIAKSIRLSFRKPYYIGIAFFLGYFMKLITLAAQLDDEEVKKFYWYNRMFERLRNKSTPDDSNFNRRPSIIYTKKG